MRRLGIAAVGLALAVGIIVGGMVGNPFGGKASAAPPRPTPTPQPVAEQNLDTNGNIKVHEQGVVDVNVVSVPPSGGACYTNWNGADCAVGWTAVSTGEWTAVTAGQGGTIICAAPKAPNYMEGTLAPSSDTSYIDAGYHRSDHDACAICCR